MRTELLTELQGLTKTTLGTFSVVTDLPWTSDGNPLYVKNPKKIYINTTETDLDPIFDTLDGQGFATESATTQVFYACDAKQLPTNYDTLTAAIKQLRLEFKEKGWTQRRALVTTEILADLLITTVEFGSDRIVTN